eukprot:10805682-Alexandrium_andersonii.AAC.1
MCVCGGVPCRVHALVPHARRTATSHTDEGLQKMRVCVWACLVLSARSSQNIRNTKNHRAQLGLSLIHI